MEEKKACEAMTVSWTFTSLACKSLWLF